MAIADFLSLFRSVASLLAKDRPYSFVRSDAEAIHLNPLALINTQLAGAGPLAGFDGLGSLATGNGRLGLAASPPLALFGGLIGALRRANDREEPAATREFRRPASLRLEAGLTQGDTYPSEIDYEGGGVPRITGGDRTFRATPVVINIHALDTQSILDRSQDIAGAVREALLNAHSLGGLIQE